MRRRSSGLVVALMLAVPVYAAAAERWPSLLPPRTTLPPAIAAGVERVWTRPTVTRHIEGERAHAPLDLYVARIDAPEVTTAAARHLRLARYDVQRLDADRYHADDGAGVGGEPPGRVLRVARSPTVSRGGASARAYGRARLSIPYCEGKFPAVG